MGQDEVYCEEAYRRDGRAWLDVVSEQWNPEVPRDNKYSVNDAFIADDYHRRHVVSVHGGADITDYRPHAPRGRHRQAGYPQARPVLRRGRRHGLLERRGPVGVVDGGQDGDEVKRSSGNIDDRRSRYDDDEY